MKTKLNTRNGRAITLVIFDLDGTLIDAYAAVARSINYALKTCGFPPVDDETIKRSVGWGDRHLLERFVGRQHLEPTLAVYRAHHKDALKKGSKLLPGAKRLLDFLEKKGYRLAVASNRPTRFSRIVLKVLGIDRYFDYVLCADKVRRPKPAGDILKAILRRFGAGPAEALYVGDMIIDVQTGRRARVKTIAVTTGSCTAAELKRLNPLAVVRRVGDVKKFLI